MTETPTLLIYTTYRLLPDDAGAFRSLASRMATMARAHDGCAFLDVAHDIEDAATFRLVEGWRDRAALDAHGASDAFQTVLKEAAALRIVGRCVDVYSVAGKETVDLPA